MIDLRQSPFYAEHMKKLGWIVETLPSLSRSSSRNSSPRIFAYIRRLPFLPISIMKIQRFTPIPDFGKIVALNRKHRVFSITLEPGLLNKIDKVHFTKAITRFKYRSLNWPLQPTSTVRVNLKQSLQVLLKGLGSDARASVRKAKQTCKVKFISTDDRLEIEQFYEFWKQNGKGYVPSQKEFDSLLQAFENNATLVLVFKDRELLSGVVILFHDRQAYYYYAATSSKGRREFAGYYSTWRAILEAKRRGCLCLILKVSMMSGFQNLSGGKDFLGLRRSLAERSFVILYL